MFLKAYSFPPPTLSLNCTILETGNVREQISEHIFAQNGVYRLYKLQLNVSLHT